MSKGKTKRQNEEKIKRLQAKRDLADKKLKMAKKKSKADEKKREDRRRYLVGEHYLEQAKSDVPMMQAIKNSMDAKLTKPLERALFDLPPREVETATAQPTGEASPPLSNKE